MNNALLTIYSGADTISFTPASYKVTYESIASPNSGRSQDGTLHIEWVARQLTKIEITLPPFKVSDPKFMGILSMVHGQEYRMSYYDYLAGKIVNAERFYTSTSAAEFYSGVLYNGIIQNATFVAVGMDAYYKSGNIPHLIPKTLTSPVLTLSGSTINWGAVKDADEYRVTDNGYSFVQTARTYTVEDRSIEHIISVVATSKNALYSESEPAKLTVERIIPELPAPSISLNGTSVVIGSVSTATSYLVTVDGTAAEYVIAPTIPVTKGSHIIRAQAKTSETTSNANELRTRYVQVDFPAIGSATVTNDFCSITEATTITASSVEGYTFDHWTDDVGGVYTGNPLIYRGAESHVFTPNYREIPAEYWTITWAEDVTFYSDDPDSEYGEWDVYGQVLNLDFESNGNNYSYIEVEGSGEEIYYNMEMVWEGSGYASHWNYVNPAYKTIKLYQDPDTVFLDEWNAFLKVNGTVEHHQNGL